MSRITDEPVPQSMRYRLSFCSIIIYETQHLFTGNFLSNIILCSVEARGACP